MSDSSAATVRRWVGRLGLLAILVLTLAARTQNLRDVFHERDGRIYFIDGDCYSRMTRAKMVSEGQWIIRHHEFENWPQGTTPHTTAPLDWLIVGLKGVCDAALPLYEWKNASVFRGQTLDLAGALISPLLGLATAAWLWWWGGRMRLPYRLLMVLFFALSPILVHGTNLGRPDHQSLLIFLIAIAVGAEFALADLGTPARLARRWAIAAGVAWGLALWVSLYEPLLFLAGAIGRHVLFNHAALTARAVRGRWIALGALLLLAVIVDGWRLSFPDATLRTYFTRWSTTIGELGHLDLTGKTPWFWTGLFGASSVILLWFAARVDKRAFSLLLLIGVMLALTIWQLRWGYFFALAVAFSVPWQLGVLRNRALGWTAGLLALLPMLWAWSAKLRPDEEKHERQRATDEAWRLVAETFRDSQKRPFLAPWWVSPKVAYWSGQPGIAGSSHQSLPGIVDSARFFTAATPQDGAAILRARGVQIVVLDDITGTLENPDEAPVVTNSREILGLAPPTGELLGQLLAGRPRRAPPFLRYVTPEERGLVIKFATPAGNKDPEQPVKLNLPQYQQLYVVERDKL